MSRRFDTDISWNRPFNSLCRTNGFHICSSSSTYTPSLWKRCSIFSPIKNVLQNSFQTRVFLELNQVHDTHHTEGIRADRPDFVDIVTKPHINFWFLSPNLINVPYTAPNSGKFLNCLHIICRYCCWQAHDDFCFALWIQAHGPYKVINVVDQL